MTNRAKGLVSFCLGTHFDADDADVATTVILKSKKTEASVRAEA